MHYLQALRMDNRFNKPTPQIIEEDEEEEDELPRMPIQKRKEKLQVVESIQYL